MIRMVLARVNGISFLFLAILFCWEPLQAKNSKAFDNLTLCLGYTTNTNRNEFHRFWQPGAGLKSYIETPFYCGDVHAGIQIVSYSQEADKVPPFHSHYVYTGWGLKWSLLKRIHFTGGVHVGNDLMSFRSGGEQIRESELGTSLFFGLIVPVLDQWECRVNYTRQLLYTHKRILRDFLTIELGKTIATPGWLREFLE